MEIIRRAIADGKKPDLQQLVDAIPYCKFLGIEVDRKGTENYQLLLGGSGAEDVSLGTITGPGFDEDGIVDAIERVTDRYLAERSEGERFVDTFRRVGMAPFKEAIYG